MKSKKIFAVTLACMMAAGSFAGCAKKKDSDGSTTTSGADTSASAADSSSADASSDTSASVVEEIDDYTFLAFMANKEINDGNDIQEELAKRTGVRIKELGTLTRTQLRLLVP